MLTTFTYDKANRLQTATAGTVVTTYMHDAAGHRTKVQSPSDLTEYTWDAPGRMSTAEVAAGTVTLTYNADGQRVVKQSTDGSSMGFLYDYKKLLNETDGDGEITNTYATTSDQEFGDLISEDGDQLYYQFDAQANTNAALDPSGLVQAKYKYYAYGNTASVQIEGDAWSSLTVDQWAGMTVDQWAELPLDLSPSKVTGMGGQKQYYLDAETELYLLGSGNNGRYYDPNTARFASEDPTRQASGDENLYRYVGNSPANATDPTGLDRWINVMWPFHFAIIVDTWDSAGNKTGQVQLNWNAWQGYTVIPVIPSGVTVIGPVPSSPSADNALLALWNQLMGNENYLGAPVVLFRNCLTLSLYWFSYGIPRPPASQRCFDPAPREHSWDPVDPGLPKW